IELGEIEAALASHPQVQEAVALVRDGRLAAYVVGREGEERESRTERGGTAQRGAEKSSPRALRLLSASSAVNSPSLRSHLKARLPTYMLPSAIVTLESFPRTPNGKLDRKALPEPEWESSGEFVAPGTPTEEVVAGVWAEVLGREQVGVEDNFFDLGGHSLLATQVMSRLRQALEVELSLQQLFEAPTVAGLSEAVEKARLAGRPLQAPPIRPVSRDEPLPLSFAQQRLWFLDQLEPGSAAYNILSAERLQGPLDVGLLAHSLNLLIDRHEALRTTFSARRGQPLQIIAERLRIPLPVMDLRPLPTGLRDQQAHNLTRSEAGRPFNLSRGPLIRSALLRLQDEEWVILLSLHHTISDDWSIGILFDELNTVYGGRSQESGVRSQEEGEGTGSARIPAGSATDGGKRQKAGGRRQEEGEALVRGSQFAVRSPEKEPETSASEPMQPHSLTASQPSSPTCSLQPTAYSLLPPLPIQYADYAVWQRNWLQGEVLEQQLSYWKEQFLDVPEGLNLPTDRPRPALQSYRGAYLPVTLPEPLSEAVDRLGRRQGSTLFMTLMAAFSALLSRWSGQSSVLVGYPVAGRNRRELESLIGFFVNTLVLRADLRDDPAFSDLLGQVRHSALQAYGYQELPFERLVEELQLKRDLSRNPLFQVMFMMQNAPSPREEASGLTARRQEVEAVTSKFDLTLSLEMSSGRLRGSLIYCRDLFDPTTMLRLLNHFEGLLESASADPSQAVSELPLLSPSESQQLLHEWNDAQAPDLGRSTIVSWFNDRVQQSPDRIALLSHPTPDSPSSSETDSLQPTAYSLPPSHLSYADLSHRSALLAAELIRRGTNTETLIGLYAERSFEMVIGLLGVLRAGAAYLPLDPIYPAPRIAAILQEAQPLLILTQGHLLEELPQSATATLCLDSPQPLSESSLRPPCLCGSSLSYVIYTSGSTGRPKGVQITHHALANFLESMRQSPGLGAQDILLAVTTISFDIAALELLLPLITGARLVLASREEVLEGSRFLDLLARSSATVMQGTPATWRLLLAAGWKGAPHLKVLCGGEALPTDLASEIQSKADSLWNMYGPTETTIWSAVSPVVSCQLAVQNRRPETGDRKSAEQTEHPEPLPLNPTASSQFAVGSSQLAVQRKNPEPLPLTPPALQPHSLTASASSPPPEPTAYSLQPTASPPPNLTASQPHSLT
ncbi:MAG: condensation domain-containing protein, partial [Acidobacteriota bacterium]